MKETIDQKIAALTRKAKETGSKTNVKLVASSSLHQVIRTKEQAERFMKLLKEA